MITREGTKRILKIAIIGIVILIVLVYTYFTTRDYISGPKIIIDSPTNGSLISTSTVSIIGTALRIKEITLNNRPTFIDENGHFEEVLLLFPGYNVAVISAIDKFGRKAEKRLELIYEK